MVTEATHNPGVKLASPDRRLAGQALDLVLFIVTLGVGWGVWYLFVASQGQTPAKQILGMRVVDDDGQPAGLIHMVIRREFLFVPLLILGETNGLLGAGIFLAAWMLSAAWCIWDGDHQTLWDKLVGTRVITDRYGSLRREERLDAEARLRTLASLRRSGVMSDEEYERRAREIAGR